MKKTLILITFIFLTACSSPEETLQPSATPAPTKTPLPSPTPTPETTTTNTPRPTKTPIIEFKPEHFSFPVIFEGEYALEQKLSYAPCFHWDGNYEISGENWYDDFHAGDMHILHYGTKPQMITILSPVSGTILNVVDFGENGLLIEIETDFYYEGKQVYVDVSHVNEFYPGDDTFPEVSVGSTIKQGQPFGISNRLFDWGLKQQSLDIAIRNGSAGANPEYSNFAPTSYLDPYLFLIDDIQLLDSHIVFDYKRDHCLLSAHFPQP